MKSSLIDKIKVTFQDKFGTKPIVVCSPGRLNLIGEHTDYNDGFVLPAAIDKYMVAAVSKSDSQSCNVLAIDKEEEFQFNLEDLEPIPSNSWKNYILGIVAEIQGSGRFIQAFNLVFGSDIPEGAGLSSSAALENSVVFALNELFNLNMTKLQMIAISQKAEHNFVGVQCGIMDQFASMFGNQDHALFLDCRSLEAEIVRIDLRPYTLVIINSNVKHNLAENAYNERRALCEKAAKLLGIRALRDAREEDLDRIKSKLTKEEFQKIVFVVQENNRVQKAVNLLKENNIVEFGNLLFEAHAGMRDLFQISCAEIDYLVDLALKSPYVGGSRMMGGGFGGCTINLVEEGRVENFIKETKKAYLSKFNNPCSSYQVTISNGTQLLE